MVIGKPMVSGEVFEKNTIVSNCPTIGSEPDVALTVFCYCFNKVVN